MSQMTKTKIYTVTVLQKIDLEYLDEDNFLPTFGDRRCVGYCLCEKDAIDSVLKNVGDIHCGMYQYAVVEEVHERIYKYSKNRWVFEWKNDAYEEIEEPIELSNVCGFGIG